MASRSFKYRIYPNDKEKALLARYFGAVRFVYNHFLKEKKQQYIKTGTSDVYGQQAKTLTQLKRKKGYEWLKEINSQTLLWSLKNLDIAYWHFFKHHKKYPRFKSKKGQQCFCIPQRFKIKGKKIFIPKWKEGIKFNKHRNIQGTPQKIYFTLTPSGKYYVIIRIEKDYKPWKKKDAQVGVDLGLKDLIITSDGVKYPNNKYLKSYETKIIKTQQHLAKKQKGSKSWEKQRIKLARLHEKVHNCRIDNLHKISKALLKQYDVVCCESLAIQKMMGNHKRAKAISDASWGSFVIFLQYKAKLYGRKVVKIDRYYPSSKTCHYCGYIKKDLTLKDREWICPQCGHVLDRDINASINILNEGIKQLSAGTVDYTDGVITDKTL